MRNSFMCQGEISHVCMTSCVRGDKSCEIVEINHILCYNISSITLFKINFYII
jgi:hypothetical protein